MASRHRLPWLVLLVTVVACSTEPEPILYGVQECAHCRMTIAARPFAAQLMTDKGRTHSFDAIECMMRYTSEHHAGGHGVRLFRVADQLPPHDLFDATLGLFVISEAIPSPMGGNLSAFRSREDASVRLAGEQGMVLTWSELLAKFQKP